jgi:hypothetical protein
VVSQEQHTSNVIPTCVVISIKIQYSSLNHLRQCKPLYQLRRTPFMEIDDKGGEIVQRYEYRGEIEDKKIWGKDRR